MAYNGLGAKVSACSIGGCDKPCVKTGLCGMHYRRKQRHGDPLVVLQPKGLSLRARFDRDVVVEDGCWRWKGKRTGRGGGGYASVFWMGQWRIGSRISWELHRGPIPPGMHVLHRCDNVVCTNPEHLFLGTNADNIADKVSKGRQYRINGDKCSHDGCEAKPRTMDLCKKHYNAQYHARRRAAA